MVKVQPTQSRRLIIVQITMMTPNILYRVVLAQSSLMEIGSQRIMNHLLSRRVKDTNVTSGSLIVGTHNGRKLTFGASMQPSESIQPILKMFSLKSMKVTFHLLMMLP